MNARSFHALPVVFSLLTACLAPSARQATQPEAPAQTPATPAPPASTATDPTPTTPSSVASGAAEGTLPASSLKIGGVSLSDLTPEQVVDVLFELGYQARPSNPSAFSGIPVWDDRFTVFSFEILKDNSSVGTVELVRPARGRKSGERNAGAFIKDAVDASAGLIDGNGFLDAPSDTALTAVIDTKEGGSALQFLLKVMRHK